MWYQESICPLRVNKVKQSKRPPHPLPLSFLSFRPGQDLVSFLQSPTGRNSLRGPDVFTLLNRTLVFGVVYTARLIFKNACRKRYGLCSEYKHHSRVNREHRRKNTSSLNDGMFHRILSVPRTIVMDLNNVMSSIALSSKGQH